MPRNPGHPFTHHPACEREPIHIPGSVQPHGHVIVLSEQGTIVSISRHTIAAFGLLPETVIGLPITALLGDGGWARLHLFLGMAESERTVPISIAFCTDEPVGAWEAILHRRDGLLILDIEPLVQGFSRESAAVWLLAATTRLNSCDSTLLEVYGWFARDIRELSGFDRVMVYRFNKDFDGEVVADQHAEGMGSYFGNHFPESDIPAQARALYAANTIRIIPDAGYEAEPLLPDRHPETGCPIDLSHSTLRSISPVHRKYMQNMGVVASMSISVVKQGHLVALIACHHRTPHFVPYRIRQTADDLARLLAGQIEIFEERSVAAATDTIDRAFALITSVTRNRGPQAILTVLGLSVLEVLQASGLALLSEEAFVRIDHTPDQSTIREIVATILNREDDEVFTSDRIAVLHPLAEKLGASFCGMMAIKLPRAQGWLLWFRPEWRHERVWAGKPVGYVSRQGEINPRRSFAPWIERRQGLSRPWSETDIAAARRFAVLLVQETPPALEASR